MDRVHHTEGSVSLASVHIRIQSHTATYCYMPLFTGTFPACFRERGGGEERVSGDERKQQRVERGGNEEGSEGYDERRGDWERDGRKEKERRLNKKRRQLTDGDDMDARRRDSLTPFTERTHEKIQIITRQEFVFLFLSLVFLVHSFQRCRAILRETLRPTRCRGGRGRKDGGMERRVMVCACVVSGSFCGFKAHVKVRHRIRWTVSMTTHAQAPRTLKICIDKIVCPLLTHDTMNGTISELQLCF